jgi:DNA invertase Pin-like site-specific DNA recombinase
VRIDRWIEETVSATRKLSERKLGSLLQAMQPDDILIVSELSRLGRSLLEVMSILHTLMEQEVKVFTTKERYELGHNISSNVLAFAFSLSAEIERAMISQRTQEASPARSMRASA